MATDTTADLEFFVAAFRSIADDLSMIMDTQIDVAEPRAERVQARAAGEGQVHISYRFLVHDQGQDHHGCVLTPLPDSIGLASFLMMMQPDEVAERRKLSELDRSLKESIVEVGNFIAGAIDAVIRSWYPSEASCRSLGCQGVRADVRPAFRYREGTELAVGRATVSVAGYEPFEMILQVPPPTAA